MDLCTTQVGIVRNRDIPVEVMVCTCGDIQITIHIGISKLARISQTGTAAAQVDISVDIDGIDCYC